MSIKIIPREILCKSALNKTGIPGYDYCLNPYVGCTHGCIYCYASFMCRFTGHKEKWSEFVDVKINMAEILAKQLCRRCRPQGKVLFGTVTDTYQPVEADCRITRSCLELCADYKLLSVDILTKSSLVTRDIDILRCIPVCEVGFTITTLDHHIARVLEPGATSPQERLQAACQVEEAGIPVWIFIAPLLPGISDRKEDMQYLLKKIHAAGIKKVWLDFLNPYPTVLGQLKTLYRQHFPSSLKQLEDYVRAPEAFKSVIIERLHQINAQIGCGAQFVS